MDSATSTEAELLSKIQSSNDLIGIHSSYTKYLDPFTIHLKPTTTKKSSKSKSTYDQRAIRDLAKRFLPFLYKSLTFMPKRLSECPKFAHHFAVELFDAYQLCLCCIELIAPELSGKPYLVQLHRLRYIHCLENWELYKQAETECFLVLKNFQGIVDGESKRKGRKYKARLVPRVNEESVDQEFAALVLEPVLTLLKCASKNQNKENDYYRRVIAVAEESQPWFSVLEAKERDKFYRSLALNLHRITMFFVGELTIFEVDLIVKFSLATFEAYKQSPALDEMYKFATRICSSLFCQENEPCSQKIIDILKCVLNFMATECKVGVEKAIQDFLEFVCYCVNKCRRIALNVSDAVAGLLNELGGDFYQAFTSISLILRLYATGLLLCPSNRLSEGRKVSNSSEISNRSTLQFLQNNRDTLQRLSALINLSKGHFNIGGKENIFLQERTSCLSSVCDALKFLCQPVAECILSEKSEIFAETDSASYWTNLGSIQDAFQHFCYVFLHYLRCSQSERKIDTSDEDCKLIFSVAVANLVLSFRTGYNTKETVNTVKHVILFNWLPAKRLKKLHVPLHNVAVILNKNKWLKESVKALKLCCKALWKCVVNLFETHIDKTNKLKDDLAEYSIADLVKEASEETVFLLDLLDQEDSYKINKIIRECLETWSAAVNLVETLPPPERVMRYWIKRACKLSKDVEVDHVAMLHSLASSSTELSKRTLENLLEQELLMYKEMSSLNPRVCYKMRLEIIGVLLEEVYTTKERCLDKSRILIEKGRELRADGTVRQNESLQCLSDAISTLKAIYSKSKSCSSRVHHLLVRAYILRALCAQEAEHKSKIILQESNFLQDIQAAVELCLSPNHCHEDDQCMIRENVLNLLYMTIDLLSAKGYLESHQGMYDVVIQLFNQEKIPLEKMLSELWKNRRLSHALCASPMNEVFIRTFSKHCSQFLKSDDFWRTCMTELKPLVVGFNLTNNDIKQAASDFISNGPQCSGSMFLSSHLYYNLSERLISSGELIEALVYAKEAHRLRTKLLQEKFKYTVAEDQTEFVEENGEIIEKSYHSVQTFQIRYLVVVKGWLGDGISSDYEGCVLTPWNVLSCYLESVLQVGTVQEVLGNYSEAEKHMWWGKSISQFEGLPLFEISFSSMLGKLYRKRKFWALAEKELFGAKKTLDEHRSAISCMKCVCALEVTINQQLGDLFLSSSCNREEKSTTRLCLAKNSYRLALEKLNLSAWRDSELTTGKRRGEQIISSRKSLSGCAQDLVVAKDSSSTNGNAESKFNTRRPRKTKKELKHDTRTHIAGHNRRMTRSAYRSLGESCEITPSDIQIGATSLNNVHLPPNAPTGHENVLEPETEYKIIDFEGDISCLCSEMRCWHCLHLEAVESGSLSSFLCMRWQLVHRKLSLRLLISIGKYFGIHGNIHDAHKLFLQSVSVLFRKYSSCSKYSSPSLTLLIDSIGTDFPGDCLAVERAALLYYICWFTLKSCHHSDAREVYFEHTCFGTSEIVPILKSAFLLSHEVPLLFQKISRLLAVLYVLSTSIKPSLLSLNEVGCESQWASYFHQASIGTHLNQQLYNGMMTKQQYQHATDPADMEYKSMTLSVDLLQGRGGDFSFLVCSASWLYGGSPRGYDNCKIIIFPDRAAPTYFLRCCNQDSFLAKPQSTIRKTSTSLRLTPELHENLEEFLTRFFQELPCAPVICISLISGADSVLLGDLLSCPSVEAWILLSHLNSENQHVILLPVNTTPEDDDGDPSIGVSFKSKDFIKSWKCPWVSSVVDYIAPKFREILEGNYYSSSEHFLEDTKENISLWWMIRKRLDGCLCKFLLDMEDLWLGVWKYVLLGEWPNLEHLDSVEENLSEEEKRVLQIILTKRCHVDVRSEASVDVNSLMQSVFEKLSGTQEDDKGECMKRSPIVLVLGFEVQMLPWENLPILRNREVYRMPSVGSILATFNRWYQERGHLGTNPENFPLIDPLDLYYLLNPDGSLNSTQVEFENWFQDQNFEGKTATVPPIRELMVALQNHDLFVYMGHGSGMQYMPGNKIQELDSCAATLLMGCSSGSLFLRGCYSPEGAPISYLLAGSPIIVANLWEVTDKDIDRFSKAVLNAWLRERKEANDLKCVQCDEDIEKYSSRNCIHRPRLGSVVGEARAACKLPFLNGASPVCYGVPTGIIKEKNIVLLTSFLNLKIEKKY